MNLTARTKSEEHNVNINVTKLIYFSPTGTTKKLVKAIAEGCRDCNR